MARLLKNRYALSTVVTTLIILVVSILLASVVTYFAINVVSTRVQQESLSLTNVHLWVDKSGSAVGAIMISNTGGRDVVIHQLTVRGQECPWNNVYYLNANKNDTGLTAVLPYLNATQISAGTVTGFANALVTTSGQLVLPSGNTMIIYVTSPDSVTINDVGLSTGMTVFSAQAIYAQETNVQAAPA